MDAVASEISLVERSRRCAIHIFTQTRFLEVTISKSDAYNLGGKPQKGSLCEAAECRYIFGGIYRNRDKTLPDQEGGTWYECDID